MHWFPKYSEASLMILGFLIAAEFIETLSAPALSKACIFSIDEIIYNKSDKVLIATFSRFCWEFVEKKIKGKTFYLSLIHI